MLRLASSCLLIILQIVIAEPTPPQCRGPPPGMTHPEKCCNFPSLFKDEDFEECGIERFSDDEDHSKRGPLDCSQEKCLLNKYKMMKDDEEIDKDATIEFLDKWAGNNQDYKDAVEKAKEKCLKTEILDAKLPCRPTTLFRCIKYAIFVECTQHMQWEDTDNCKKLKDLIEECKPYITQT
ncbi:uncharacterized protein LOC123658393 [Melitaea cinxia]|uniref:uncharacterized protein LOC123658393 n=1 Tax=Melitaea cinxia TaxID=113334 RepID=UPI001E2743EA|nr:uncharacterized protein LOC123658393 [Melitaea cinxia]